MARQTPAEKFNRALERQLSTPKALLTALEFEEIRAAGTTPLPSLTHALRDIPREGFKERLRFNLERRAKMATRTQAAPEARASATPYLSVRNAAAALEFYKKAFGATEVMRLMQPDGRVGHAQIDIEGARIMLADEFPEFGFKSPESLGGSSVHINLDVKDVDAMAQRAVAAGANIVRPVEDQFYGERSGQFRDPFGFIWSISTHKETLSTEEMQRRMDEMSRNEAAPPTKKYIREGFHSITPYLVVPHVAQLIEFLKGAFGAEERFRVNRPGTEVIMHAELKIGDSMLEIADANDQFPPTPATMILHVDDVDVVFQRAVEAGATVLQPVADQEYGARSATVQDASGNKWSIGKPSPGNAIFKDYRSITPHFNPLRAPAMIEFLQKAFGAEEVYRAQSPDGVVHHAQMRIGDSVIGMGEAYGPYQPAPATLHLYVPDADALYDRALRAGATSIQPVAEQPYGDRSGGVTDPFGNRWFIATHIRDVAF
ncbi:MAG TPA: VOC family protein [Candidatus Acidoferrales bacterium]|nr:VOC family protein [Candidatus Acidoferrales bacterium]